MAYETGTASGPSDLVGKLVTFAATLGWTISGVTTSAAAWTTPLSTSGRVFSKGELVYGIGYDTDDVFVVPSTAVDGGAAWNAQTGSTVVSSVGYLSRSNDMAGPYSVYHFFGNTNPDYLHVVVEKTPGIFKHIQIGMLKKFGSFTGGAYCCTAYWHADPTYSTTHYQINDPDSVYHVPPFGADCNIAVSNNSRNYVRADIDGKTNNWMPFHTTYGQNNARGVVRNAYSLYESLFERSPSEFNLLTPLYPIQVFVDRPSALVSPAGQVPDMRYLNMLDFIPGEIANIAGVEWMVFPIIQKTETWTSGNQPTQVPSSGNYGLAYKRN